MYEFGEATFHYGIIQWFPISHRKQASIFSVARETACGMATLWLVLLQLQHASKSACLPFVEEQAPSLLVIPSLEGSFSPCHRVLRSLLKHLFSRRPSCLIYSFTLNTTTPLSHFISIRTPVIISPSVDMTYILRIYGYLSDTKLPSG